MSTRSAAAGILALVVLASTVTAATVTDTQPASAHVAYTQNCWWETSTNYTIIRYDWSVDGMYWHDFGNGEGEYRYGAPVWGYERYRRCGPRVLRPHTHNPWAPFFICGLIGIANQPAGLVCGASAIKASEGH
ncbi:MAG: hypothetical protein OXB92_04565 [Acidimicrobiaceae bacterium]|nr:hypothetical protein [Acidimicrobiia bacterium]MCY4493115.1 hypothetical protein [Acidimicrobiaceae bacterium]